MKKFFFSFLLILTLFHTGFAKSTGFTQEDRERLIRLEATLQTFMEQTNKRFEDMNKRFEDMNKRFEDMNKRFEDMNKRLDSMVTLMNRIVIGLFGLVAAFGALLIWDRRSTIKAASQEIEEWGSA